MRRAIALAAACAALTAGCGGTTTRTITAPSSASGPTSTAPSGPITITTPTSTAPPPKTAPSRGTLAQAEATVKGRGFTVDDPGDYRSSQTLRVLIGTRAGSSDGFAKRAFFFVGGRYLGTDTSDDSADITVAHQQDTLVTLAYRLYRKGDPLCCPTGGQTLVRYQWNGSRLTPLDPIPSSSANAPVSRL